MGIGDKLRNRRMDLGLSRSQLAKQIHVTPSAVANYENGISYPKPDILISLIMALEVDANYLYQDYLSNSKVRALYGRELSQEEEESISKYRELSEDGKHLVRLIIDEEHQRNKAVEWVEYPCVLPGVRKLHSGFLFQGGKQNIKIKRKHILEDMQFCFQIQIDRYEPVFKKYDIVALKSAPAEHNEIGIFKLNDVYYLRTLCKTQTSFKIRSLNVDEADIEITEKDSFQCIGTILGKIYGTYEITTLKE